MDHVLALLRRTFLNPGLYAGVAIAILLVVGAYQVRPSYNIAFGSATDAPLLRGFNAGEQSQEANSFPFRWTNGDSSITLRDVGRQDFDATVTLGGARPANQPPAHVTIDAGGPP